MNRVFFCLAVSVWVSVLGCFPEKRVAWSPDGRLAAVVGGDGLYLCDETGKLSPRIAEDVRWAAWLPDSRGLVVVQTERVERWSDLAPLLTEQQRAALTAAGTDCLAELRSYRGELDDFEPAVFDDLTPGQAVALMLYLRDEHAEALRDRFGEEAIDGLADVQAELSCLRLFTVTGETAQPGALICRVLGDVYEPLVAPSGRAVAFVAAGPGFDAGSTRLLVVPAVAGAVPREVAQYVANFPDWSADGRDLVFAHTATWANDELRLGLINRRRVCDADGNLLKEFAEAEELAGIAFQQEIRIRCLRDGRILFAAMELHIPCALGDLPESPTLFALDPERTPVVTRLLPRQAERELCEGLYFFELSPDQRRLTVPGAKGALCVLSLATAEVWTVSEAFGAGEEIKLLPTWRSNDEICAAVAPASEGTRADVALLRCDWRRKVAATSRLSADWPDEVLRGIVLEEQGDE